MKELTPINPKTRQLVRIYSFNNSYVIVGKKADLLRLEIGGDEAAICVPKEILAAELEPIEEPT